MTTPERSWSAGPYMHRVGKRIAEARGAAGMTQQRLSDLIGVTRSSVANMEAGRQSVDAVQLAQIARALRVDLAALVLLDDLPPEPALPHDVEIRRVWEVTCRTCGPGQPLAAARDRGQAEQSRKDHVAEMLAREGGGVP